MDKPSLLADVKLAPSGHIIFIDGDLNGFKKIWLSDKDNNLRQLAKNARYHDIVGSEIWFYENDKNASYRYDLNSGYKVKVTPEERRDYYSNLDNQKKKYCSLSNPVGRNDDYKYKRGERLEISEKINGDWTYKDLGISAY